MNQRYVEKIEKSRPRIGEIFSFAFFLFLTIFLVMMREQISHLDTLGYPGIFLISLLSHATIIIPMPAVIMTSAFGAIFDPFWVAILAGIGAALGELTGYLSGVGGSATITQRKWYDKTREWITGKYGGPAIFFLAFIPNPLFDIAGMIAGASKMSLYKFFLWCLLGKVLKMLVFAYGGDLFINHRF